MVRAFFGLAYDIGVRNLPDGQTALGYTRRQWDRLGIGAELTHSPWGSVIDRAIVYICLDLRS